jgi:hypothetical protein
LTKIRRLKTVWVLLVKSTPFLSYYVKDQFPFRRLFSWGRIGSAPEDLSFVVETSVFAFINSVPEADRFRRNPIIKLGSLLLVNPVSFFFQFLNASTFS